MNRLSMTELWHCYLSGLLAVAPVSLSVFTHSSFAIAAMPLIVLAGAVAGSYLQRRQPPSRTTVEERTGWILVRAFAWSALLCQELFFWFLMALGRSTSDVVNVFWFLTVNLAVATVVGYLASFIQLSMATTQIDRRNRWLNLGTLSWIATALALSTVLTIFQLVSYPPLLPIVSEKGAWILFTVVGIPPIWVLQFAIARWALQPSRSPQ